jgi:hypothetical protein
MQNISLKTNVLHSALSGLSTPAERSGASGQGGTAIDSRGSLEGQGDQTQVLGAHHLPGGQAVSTRPDRKDAEDGNFSEIREVAQGGNAPSSGARIDHHPDARGVSEGVSAEPERPSPVLGTPCATGAQVSGIEDSAENTEQAESVDDRKRRMARERQRRHRERLRAAGSSPHSPLPSAEFRARTGPHHGNSTGSPGRKAVLEEASSYLWPSGGAVSLTGMETDLSRKHADGTTATGITVGQVNLVQADAEGSIHASALGSSRMMNAVGLSSLDSAGQSVRPAAINANIDIRNIDIRKSSQNNEASRAKSRTSLRGTPDSHPDSQTQSQAQRKQQGRQRGIPSNSSSFQTRATTEGPLRSNTSKILIERSQSRSRADANFRSHGHAQANLTVQVDQSNPRSLHVQPQSGQSQVHDSIRGSHEAEKGSFESRVVSQDVQQHRMASHFQIQQLDASEPAQHQNMSQLSRDVTRKTQASSAHSQSELQQPQLLHEAHEQNQRQMSKQTQYVGKRQMEQAIQPQAHIQQSQQVMLEHRMQQSQHVAESLQNFSSTDGKARSPELSSLPQPEARSHSQQNALSQGRRFQQLQDHHQQQSAQLFNRHRHGQDVQQVQSARPQHSSREVEHLDRLNESHFLAHLEQHDNPNLNLLHHHGQQTQVPQQSERARSSQNSVVLKNSAQAAKALSINRGQTRQLGEQFADAQYKTTTEDLENLNSGDHSRKDVEERHHLQYLDPRNIVLDGRLKEKELQAHRSQSLSRQADKNEYQQTQQLVSYNVEHNQHHDHDEQIRGGGIMDIQQQSFMGEEHINQDHQKGQWASPIQIASSVNEAHPQTKRPYPSSDAALRHMHGNFSAHHCSHSQALLVDQTDRQRLSKQSAPPSFLGSSNPENPTPTAPFPSTQEQDCRRVTELSMSLARSAGALPKVSPLQPPQLLPPAWAVSAAVQNSGHPSTHTQDVTPSPQLHALAFSASLRHQSSPASIPGLRDALVLHAETVGGQSLGDGQRTDVVLGGVQDDGETSAPEFDQFDGKMGVSKGNESTEQRKRRLARERQRRRRKRLRGDAELSDELANPSESDLTPSTGNLIPSLSQQPMIQLPDIHDTSRHIPSSAIHVQQQGIPHGASRLRMSLGANISADVGSQELHRLNLRTQENQGVARPQQPPITSPRSQAFSFRGDFNHGVEFPLQAPELAANSGGHRLADSLRENTSGTFDPDSRLSVTPLPLRSSFTSRMASMAPSGHASVHANQILPPGSWTNGSAAVPCVNASDTINEDVPGGRSEGDKFPIDTANESTDARKRRLARERQRKRRDRLRCGPAGPSNADLVTAKPRASSVALAGDGVDSGAWSPTARSGLVSDVGMKGNNNMNCNSKEADLMEHGNSVNMLTSYPGITSSGKQHAVDGPFGMDGALVGSGSNREPRRGTDRGACFPKGVVSGTDGGEVGYGILQQQDPSLQKPDLLQQASWQQGFASEAQARFAVEDASRVLRSHLEGLSHAQRPYVLQQSLLALAANDRYLRDLLGRGSTA